MGSDDDMPNVPGAGLRSGVDGDILSRRAKTSREIARG
jgi:hypothetical protein